MFSVTYAQLNAWLTAFLWSFVRILAFVASAPVIGHASVPVRVKIGLAAFTTLIVAPMIGALPQPTVFSAAGVWVIVNQFLIGAALGFTMQIVFGAVQTTGGIVGMQMGLGFATFFDANASNASDVLSRYLNTIAMLAFLAVDGHLQIIAALAATFQAMPVSANLLAAPGWRALVEWGGTLFSAGLLLALPVVAALLIVNLALGILNRAAPQIGVFQIGFPVTMLVGMLLLQAMLPNMIPSLSRMFDLGVEAFGRVLSR
jgi:flagellar biosynthetic protein FliR